MDRIWKVVYINFWNELGAGLLGLARVVTPGDKVGQWNWLVLSTRVKHSSKDHSYLTLLIYVPEDTPSAFSLLHFLHFISPDTVLWALRATFVRHAGFVSSVNLFLVHGCVLSWEPWFSSCPVNLASTHV